MQRPEIVLLNEAYNILNLRGLFNAKAILVEKYQWYYLTNNWEVLFGFFV